MKRNRWLALLLALLMLCTGCSMDVESFLQPPKTGGEQQAVRGALETYLQDKGHSRYTLEHPVEGEHTAAFLLCDGMGYPIDEGQEPQRAVAFYSLPSAPDETHIHLLTRTEKGWETMADTLGDGVDIRQVAFGDLNGDGAAELVTGWDTYYNRVSRLAVYAQDESLTRLSEEQTYSSLFVGDITATGEDSLVVFTIAGAGQVIASLQRIQEDRLEVLDTVNLDGDIQQFGSRILCRLAAEVHGLYVEGVRSDNTTVTELIYYDEGRLYAPFYDEQTNQTTVTTRYGRLSAQDIDGDTRVEIPTPILPEGQTEVGGATLIQWRTWDYVSRSWQHHSYTLTNQVDGYLVTLDDGLHTRVQAEYDEETHTLKLTDTDKKRGFLWLVVGQAQGEAPDTGLESLRLFSAAEEVVSYFAWYDPTVLEEEKVRYMVTRLTREGG